MNKTSYKLSFLSVFFTFFIDNLCWSIGFPIFAPYFLDVQNLLFSSVVSESTRTLILGFFLMTFSFGQFLGSPVLGEYADRHGRKKGLMLSVGFTFIGLVLTSWSLAYHQLLILFIGRFITGIFAGNMSICLACVTDLSQDETRKVKYFSYFAVLAGLSFVIGAFVGGKLSDPTLSSWFQPAFPMWMAAGLTFLNALFLWFGFTETIVVDQNLKFDFLESFHNIKKALQTEKIKIIYSMYFLFVFSWTVIFQFTPVLVVDKFHFTSSDIADLAIYMGFCWALGSGYLNKILVRKFSSLKVLEASLFVFMIVSGCIVLPNQILGTVAILGVCVTVGGMAWPLCTHLISSMAPKDMQGKILGMSQSVQSLSMALAPLFGGVIAQVSLRIPFFMAAMSSLIASVMYFILKRR